MEEVLWTIANQAFAQMASRESGSSPDTDGPVGCNRFPVHLEEPCAGGSPSDLRAGLKRRRSQPFKQRAILVQHGDVLNQSFDISDAVHEPIFHVTANLHLLLLTRVERIRWPLLPSHESTSFLNARKNKNVALSHQLRHIVSMAEDSDARMREHGGQSFLVCRQKLTGDLESAIFRGWRL